MIITAINNEDIFNNLKSQIESKAKEEIYMFDICLKEEVIELITKFSNKCKDKITLITRENLSDKITDKEYISTLKSINKDLKIIWCTTSLSDEDKSFLLSAEVFNILVSEEFNIDKIVESVKSKDKIIYDGRINNDNKVKKDIKEINNTIKNNNDLENIEKQFIAVYGTSGSGKSYVTNIIASSISKQTSIKPCIIDMDFENSNIDILNNLDTKNKGISKIVDEININSNIKTIVNDNTITKNKIDYIISNTSIYDYKNKISTEHYFKIYNEINKKYHSILVDLPSFPFIDVVSFTLNYATKIIFVVNPNYVSLRQALKYLELINKHFNIPKNCISIVVNKVTKNSLTIEYIKEVLHEYNIILAIPFNENEEKNINSNLFKTDESINISNLFSKGNTNLSNYTQKKCIKKMEDKTQNEIKSPKIKFDYLNIINFLKTRLVYERNFKNDN